MRKFFTIVALALLLVTASVDYGQSRAHPASYNPQEIANGGSIDDHPWGGDDTGGGGTTGGENNTRPGITAATGYFGVDYVTNYFLRSSFIKRWMQPRQTPVTITTPSTTNPGVTTTTQTN